jgi:hypothetical protein
MLPYGTVVTVLTAGFIMPPGDFLHTFGYL